MAGRKKGKAAGEHPRARTVEKGVHVTAVKATAGPPATSVHVELEPEELKREVGEFGEVRGVSARFPEEKAPGHVRWRKEPLHPAGTAEREAEGRRRIVQRYFNVHYGPADSDGLGIGVEVETDTCRVKAPAAGQAYAVKDPPQPGESDVRKTRR